jgi:segregation and condensation protein A
MAENLRRLEEERTRLHVRSIKPAGLTENQEEPELRVGLYDLLNALSGVFDRVSKEAVHNVQREAYTVEEKVELILRRLLDEGTVRFDECFKDDAIKMEVVVTFVAILELAKQQQIRLMQTEILGLIWVTIPDSDTKTAAANAGGGGSPS